MKKIQKTLTLVFAIIVLSLSFTKAQIKSTTILKINNNKSSEFNPDKHLAEKKYDKQLEKAQTLIDKKKYEEALKIIRPIAEKGYSKAEFILAGMYYNGDGIKKDKKESIKWTEKAAKHGFVDAQFNLAMDYIGVDNK